MTGSRFSRDDDEPEAWSTERAADLYRIDEWSDRFFAVADNGHMVVRSARDGGSDIDIASLVADLARQDLHPPILLRFHDVLRERVKRINEAFLAAVLDAGYEGSYRCVYPIKVNQLREVVEEILDAGEPYDMGLECGSKAELVAGLVQLNSGSRLLLCNGVKDDDMLRLMLDAQQLGRNVLPVMEKLHELERFLEIAEDLQVPARFGVRIRLDAGGSGKWAESGGSLSKFGLSVPELVDVTRRLLDEGKGDWLQLLHFHIGSQIETVNAVKDAVRELAQIYSHLHAMGIAVRYLDVGGGLGVNYGGGYGDDETSGIQYSLQEYANAIVFTAMEVCDMREVPHPIILSESGRALTAHHSVLVVDVLGAFQRDDGEVPVIGDEEAQPLQLLAATYHWASELDDEARKPNRLREAYHDAREAREQAGQLFNLGYLTLDEKANAERLYWAICRKLWEQTQTLAQRSIPPELHRLESELSDQYLCNFSVFQSMLDHWAIGQQFPIVPLTRLDEEPTRRAVLVDLTCDSDGKVNRYVCSESPKYLPVHTLRGAEPYRLGIFMVGAYQDIMGDTHNLLGRVPEVHVYADEEEASGYFIEKVVRGMSIEEMLALVQYFPNDLHRRMQVIIREQQASAGLKPRVGVELLNRYDALFRDNTYMEKRRIVAPQDD